jgi:hypothetical protein
MSEDPNPWNIPFALADFLVPITQKAVKKFEKEQKALFDDRDVKFVFPIENTLALMILICFMWNEELDTGELSKTFEIAQRTVKKMLDENIIPDLKSVN